jgi:hypothetical protein
VDVKVSSNGFPVYKSTDFLLRPVSFGSVPFWFTFWHQLFGSRIFFWFQPSLQKPAPSSVPFCMKQKERVKTSSPVGGDHGASTRANSAILVYSPYRIWRK